LRDFSFYVFFLRRFRRGCLIYNTGELGRKNPPSINGKELVAVADACLHQPPPGRVSRQVRHVKIPVPGTGTKSEVKAVAPALR